MPACSILLCSLAQRGRGIFLTDHRHPSIPEADPAQWGISAVMLLSIAFPHPSPRCTVFLVRLLLNQTYTLTSPRTPLEPPLQPEKPKTHVLYQLGRPHKAGERFPARSVDSLWRGKDAGGEGNPAPTGAGGQESLQGEGEVEQGWRVRAVARMPGHDKIRPSTLDG